MKPDVYSGPAAYTGMRPINLHDCNKKQIQEYFDNVYGLEEWLFTSLKNEEAFCKAPDRLRLPLIFYYAHPAVVFSNKFYLSGILKERIDGYFEGLFETGVDEMSWDDTENYRLGGEYKWPSVEEVRLYRLKVRKMINAFIEDTPLILPIDQNSIWWALLMGIAHQVIHIETSSVLIRQLPVDMVEKPEHWIYGPLQAKTPILENPMVKAGDVSVTLGKEKDAPVYGWDNEYGRRVVRVPKFEASQYLVTNREFFDFVEAGGYENKEYWTQEGWQWKTFREAKHPCFWVCSQGCKSGCGSELATYSHCTKENNDEKYRLRVMFDDIVLPLDWPVVVNYHESKAYCMWKGNGYRLPTEAEHQVMRSLPPFDASKETFINKSRQESNIGVIFGSSTPVDMFPPSASGFYDTFGNVWEWFADHLNGFPGYETHYLYDDFTTPCCDGYHNVIVGGSWISTGDEMQRYARYNFRRHFYQHAGFRVARTLDINDPSPVTWVKSIVYFSGYGEQKKILEIEKAKAVGLEPVLEDSVDTGITDDTKKNLADLVKKQFLSNDATYTLFDDILSTFQDSKPSSRALIIGCGPGRMAFMLTKKFKEVIGCDSSGRCIDFAIQLVKEGSAMPPTYENIEKEEIYQNGDSQKPIILPDGTKPDRLTLKQITWIPVEFGLFDLVVVDGLDRANNPKAWLAVTANILKDRNSVAVVLHPSEKTEILTKSTRMKCVKLDNSKSQNGKVGKANGPCCVKEATEISVWQKV